ncbi:MAG: AAA family ATPase, partial [Pseudomonadales bacterium]|nr:AAA family ATPase [Pseudomonadales bacterium]
MLGDRVLIDLLEDIDAHDVSRIVTEDIRPLHASKDGVCVWLQKYYGFESGLFEALAKRLSSVCELDEQRRRQLKTLFSADSREQYRAAEKALCQKLTIITGGPGTGKTWTVARIIVSLLLQNPDSRILLAAPTGKAGARMKQSLDNAFVHDKAMARYSGLLEQLPKKALTIEALLGINHHYSPKPRKNRDNPVDC